MGIPLVRNNSVDDINTSIIAIKKELGKGGSGDMGDVNVNVDVKYEVTDTVEDGNSLPVTSQGVYDYVEGQGFTPVDEVAINNMKAVTSNAVAKSLSYSTTERKTGAKWYDGRDIYEKVIVVNALARSNISTGCPAGSEIIKMRARVQWTSTSGWDGAYAVGNLQFTNTTNAVYLVSQDGTTLLNNTTGNYVKDITIKYVKPN